MSEHPYLTFRLGSSLYGIDTFAVEEIFFLPELTPIPEAPRDIVGVVNVRGYVMPVMDINIRFGYQTTDYKLTDSVIVLTSGELKVGMIVHEVQEVRTIAQEEITSELAHGRNISGAERRKFVAGIARHNENIIVLVDPEKLIHYIGTQELPSSEEHLEAEIKTSRTGEEFYTQSELLQKQRVFCPNATPEERATFHKRAEALRQKAESEDSTGLMPLAVVVLNEEFFGVDLKLVREFTAINQVTPIPCSPSQIVGNMNLRGEILTLVDIRGLLNLPLGGMNDTSQAMVINVNDVVAGIKVGEVYDVMFLNPQDVKAVPTAIHTVNDEYLQGATPYKEKMMSILDVPKILLNGGLIVEEVI